MQQRRTDEVKYPSNMGSYNYSNASVSQNTIPQQQFYGNQQQTYQQQQQGFGYGGYQQKQQVLPQQYIQKNKQIQPQSYQQGYQNQNVMPQSYNKPQQKGGYQNQNQQVNTQQQKSKLNVMVPDFNKVKNDEKIIESEKKEVVTKDDSVDYFAPYILKENASKFQISSSRVLCCKLNNERIWCKRGAMIATKGNVQFSKKDLLDDMKNVVKATAQKIAKQRIDLMKATSKGYGQVYLSGDGQKIVPFFLKKKESIIINKENILAFESSVKYGVFLMKNISSWMQGGGLFAVKLTGPGFVAIISEFDPIVFEVRSGEKLKTDYKNTIFWSGNLSPKFKTDIRLKSVFGVKSGEEFQMGWEGNSGFVGVSPCEKKKKKKKFIEKVVPENIQKK